MDISKLIPDAKASDAEWFEFEGGPFAGVAFLVRSAKAPAVKNALAAWAIRNNRAGAADNAAYIDSLPDVYADHVIFDWRGITSDGEPVPFNKEVIRSTLREFPCGDLADAIAMAANAISLKHDQVAAELEKNSQARSQKGKRSQK